jgi:hypothetical protein
MAKYVCCYGDKAEQSKMGSISEAEFEELFAEKEEFERFEFNDKGLSSEQAAELLLKHGRNELPEKVTPNGYSSFSSSGLQCQ